MGIVKDLRRYLSVFVNNDTANAIPVTVVNQLDLSTIEALLTGIKADTAAIDTNTDQVEALLSDIITEVSTQGAINNSNLQSVITELQSIDANTDTLEAQMTSIIANTALAATEATLAAIKVITDQMTFTGDDLNVTASVSVPPIQFIKDAVDTTVNEDTVTPANNEPLPVAILNNAGTVGTNVNPFGTSLFDTSTGARAIVDKNGALKVGEAIIMAGDVFGGVAPSSNLWAFGGTGANVTQAGNERIETGVAANGSRQFQTIKKARFMGSQFNVFHSGINLPDLLNEDVCFRWGAFNSIGVRNGAFFEVTGGAVPVWNLCTVKNDVVTKVPQVSWTGKGAGNFNATPNLAVFEIIYNAGSIAFFQGANLLHTQFVNVLGETYANQYHFNVGIEVENVNGNTVNNGIEVYAAVIYRLGEERGELISRTLEGIGSQLVKSGAGYIEHLYFSRTGSGGGSAFVKAFDGIDNTGVLMKRIDVGSNDYKGGSIKSTYSVGLFVEQDGSGTITSDFAFE